MEWDCDLEIAGLYIKEVVLLDLLAKSPAANLLNDSDAVVGINDPVANVEITAVGTHHKEDSPLQEDKSYFTLTGCK